MRATQFEFNYRFWLIGIIFWSGFTLSVVDHQNFAVALVHLLNPAMDPDGAQTIFWVRIVFACGALLVFLAALLRTWATAYLRVEVVHDFGIHSEKHVADGPYRHVRNPLYLANILMAAGVGTMASRLGWLVMVVGMTLFMYRLILCEEHGLLAAQGESFRNYLKTVPRLWPSLRPRLPASELPPRWGPAFLAEMFVWLFGVGVLCFAVTLRFMLSAVIFVASIAIYMVIATALKKRGAASAPGA